MHQLPCQVRHADMWFSDVESDIDQARAACSQCPLRRECLVGALERGETFGVWGGELFAQGVPVPAPRRNGRPPRDAEQRDARELAQMRSRIEAVLSPV